MPFFVVASCLGQCSDCLVMLRAAFTDPDRAREYMKTLEAADRDSYSVLSDELKEEARRTTFHCVAIHKEDD